MRRLLPLLLLLSGCAKVAPPWIAAEAASVVVFGRGIGDIVVSAVTGQDCSIVRLDRGQTYCAPPEAPPAPPPVCTRSLGVPDCWVNPEAFAVPPRGIADQPGLTALQEEHRQARWPKSLNVGL